MPNSQLFTTNRAKYKLSSLLRDPGQHGHSEHRFWHNQHQKFTQVAGKGGMDHGHTSASYSWNRKGRW